MIVKGLNSSHTRGSIRSRIMKALLGVASLSLVCFALISLDSMRRLGANSVSSNLELGNDALDISKKAMENLTKDGLLKLTIDQANSCDHEFMEIESTAMIMAEVAQQIWSSPALPVRLRSYSATERPPHPEQVSVYQYPKGVGYNTIKKDLERSAFLDQYFRPLIANNHGISDCNIGTPDGLFRRFPWGPVSADYDVRKRPWFKRAMETGKPGWSDPYIGAIANNLRLNYSVPIFHNKKIVAVIAINVPLQTINDSIVSTRLNGAGSAILIDSNFNVITREGMPTGDGNWLTPGKAERFTLDGSPDSQKRFVAELKRSGSGIFRGTYAGKDSFIAFAPVTTTGWSVLFIMPMDAVYAPIIPIEKAIATEVDHLRHQVAGKMESNLFIVSAAFLLIAAGIFLVAKRTARLITDPIMVLDEGARIIGNGNLDHIIEVTSGDEIEALATTFNRMTADLKEYLRNQNETAAARERIQSELRVATEIQTSLLPRRFPAFPDHREFDIHASMVPAKEVGGDFYDYFLVGDNRLCFLIADAADKGVPAALYMMVAKTQLKTAALRGAEPDEILRRVNNILAADNERCMFVTVFCCILDIMTGVVHYANAGHNPPIISTQEGFTYLDPKIGIVLGPIPDSTYTPESLVLNPGDAMFLFTDGVTEAHDRKGELYGKERLLEVVRRCPAKDAAEMIRCIKSDVQYFSDGEPQSDDITMLALIYRGPGLPEPG